LKRSTFLLAAAIAGSSLVPAFGQEMSFKQAVDMALTNSPEVKRVEAALSAQEFKRKAAWLNTGPRVMAEYNQVFFDDKLTAQFGPSEILIRDDESKIGSLMVAQPITGFFSLMDVAKYEGVNEDMAARNADMGRREVAFGTSELYLRALQAARMVEIAQAATEAARKQAKDGEALARVGRINHGDLLKFRLAVLQAEAGEANAMAQRNIAFANLGEATGQRDKALTLKLKPVSTSPEDLKIPSINDAIDKAEKESLEVQVADLGVESAYYGKKLAYAKFSPEVNLFAKWERNFGEQSFGGEKDTKTYGVQLTWEIWNNGSDVYGIREAAQRSYEAEAMKSTAQKQIRMRIYQVLMNLEANRKAVTLAKAAVGQSEEAYRIEQSKFSSGASSATELLLSEAARTQARGNVVAANTDFFVNYLTLQKILGMDKPSL
jgi:outer membrane protein